MIEAEDRDAAALKALAKLAKSDSTQSISIRYGDCGLFAGYDVRLLLDNGEQRAACGESLRDAVFRLLW